MLARARFINLLLTSTMVGNELTGGLTKGASFGCILLMLAITFARNLPLDGEVLMLSPEATPPGWRSIVDRWDRWHVLRIVCNVAALNLLLFGVLMDHDHNPIA